MIHVRVGCSILYETPYPTPMLSVLCPTQSDQQRLVEERRGLIPEIPVHEYIDGFGNQIWRVLAPAGFFQMDYDAVVEVPSHPDPVLPYLPKMPIEALPDNVIMFTMPSRHVPSDLFIDDAWRLFGHIDGGWAQVQAICDWLHSHIQYGTGSTSSTSAWEAYQQGRGVCRDFAHLGVAFCRALNFPARYVCGYLPDINVPYDPTPMDFHAWFEVYLDGAWRTFDARHNFPRIGRVVIGYGRDAVDVAFSTVYGSPRLTEFRVWAYQVSKTTRLNPHNLPTA